MTYDVCEADNEYIDCIVYEVIIENKPICLVMDDCITDFKKLSTKIALKLIKKINI
jgi:hypothetical protein